MLGLLAVAVFVLATLPAGVVFGRLERYGVTADAVGGTLWSGRAQGLAAGGNHLGDLQWSLRPGALLGGRLAGHAVLVAADGRIETDFERAWSGRLQLESARADMSLTSLTALGVPFARNWRGQVAADLSSLVLEDDWPVAAVGTIDVRDLTAPPPRETSLGGYRLTFPASSGTAEKLEAVITQTDGPLLLDGELTLGRDRSFQVDGRLAPRGSAPPDLTNLLQALGPPDAHGRRPFSMSGTF
jgi:general secretion pathway protein N